MAPFSICSVCTVKTRKVVRDPKTRKNIYVCPLCHPGKGKKNRKKVKKDDEPSVSTQPQAIDVEEDVEMTLQKVPNESLEVPIETIDLSENDPGTKAEEAQAEEETPAEAPAETPEEPPAETPEEPPAETFLEVIEVEMQVGGETVMEVDEFPLNDTTNANDDRPKITPPMMEIVVVEGRKYIAVSATADFDSR